MFRKSSQQYKLPRRCARDAMISTTAPTKARANVVDFHPSCGGCSSHKFQLNTAHFTRMKPCLQRFVVGTIAYSIHQSEQPCRMSGYCDMCFRSLFQPFQKLINAFSQLQFGFTLLLVCMEQDVMFLHCCFLMMVVFLLATSTSSTSTARRQELKLWKFTTLSGGTTSLIAQMYSRLFAHEFVCYKRSHRSLIRILLDRIGHKYSSFILWRKERFKCQHCRLQCPTMRG